MTAMRAMAKALAFVPHPCFRDDPCLACEARADRATHDREFGERHGIFWPADKDPLAARTPRVPEHGTLNEYTSRRCRCDECRAAMARYARERRMAKRVAASPIPDVTRSHLEALERQRCDRH